MRKNPWGSRMEVDNGGFGMEKKDLESQPVEILVFYIGKTVYGLLMEEVEEIIGIQKIIPLPGAVDGILGMINLRSQVVPIVDSNYWLKEEVSPFFLTEEQNRGIVIVLFQKERVGIIVDDMCDVLSVYPEQFVSLQEKKEQNRFLKNFVRTEEQLISMLDLEEMLTFGEMDS